MQLSVPRVTGLVFVVGVLVCSFVNAAEPARTIIIVRHSERAGGTGPEVGLSDAGQCRAKVLATMLASAGIRGIYTSEVKRTQQTAEPLAKCLNLQVEAIPSEDIDRLVSKLRASPAEGVVLVVGHSNTVPAIVERLSGQTVPPISDTEFDRMFVVTVFGQQSKVLTLRFPGCAP